MAVTNYYTVNGKIKGEGTAAAGYRPYGHDALGSVVATYDSTGALQNTYRNAPYGTQVAKTGTAPDPAFLYNGGSGYRTTGRNYSPYYVRKRHLDNKTAQWTTVDPLWPVEGQYAHADGNPVNQADPTGEQWQGNPFPSPPFLTNPLNLWAAGEQRRIDRAVSNAVRCIQEFPPSMSSHWNWPFQGGAIYPIYGNFCGPQTVSGEKIKNRGGNPIDHLDGCCRQHDHCFDKYKCGLLNQLTVPCEQCSIVLCLCAATTDCQGDANCTVMRRIAMGYACSVGALSFL